MSKSRYIGIAVAMFLSGAVSSDAGGRVREETGLKGSRPSIILVLTDDQGMGDLSCMGNPVLRTPHLDRFHEEALRFSDFHVSPTCAPTRSAMMSGRRPFEVGVSHTILLRERLAPDVVTFPEALQSAGYTTALFGKWHLGDEEAYLPQNRGFDEVLMHGAGGIGQYRWGDFKANEENIYFDNVLLHNDTIVKTKGFCTDLFFEAALDWIRKEQNSGKPYFTYIALNAPHGPMIAPAEYKQRFLEMGYDEDSAARYGMIENIDSNFGRMMLMLEEVGALENTLVIFMTDNGMSMAPVKISGAEQTVVPFNAGLRGQKNDAWEGGTRVPSFWYWKGVLDGGTDIDALTAHIDLYKTFCELAGADVPESPLPPTGRSLLPLLEDSEADWADRKLFVHRGRWDDYWNKKDRDANKYNGAAVRTARWRLVFDMKDGEVMTHLSNISTDPGETENVAGMYPDVVKELSNAYDQWWESTEPLLVNDGSPLEEEAPEKHPFNVRYDKQLAEQGIPAWSPVYK